MKTKFVFLTLSALVCADSFGQTSNEPPAVKASARPLITLVYKTNFFAFNNFFVTGTATPLDTNDSVAFYPKIAFLAKGPDEKIGFLQGSTSLAGTSGKEKKPFIASQNGESFICAIGETTENNVRTSYSGSGNVWIFAVKEQTNSVQDRISNIIKVTADFTAGTLKVENP